MPLSSVVGAQSIVRPGVCTSSTKPASPYDGQVIYMTDVDQTVVWDGSAWVVLAPIAGGRNKVINGGMSVWQRGTSFSDPANMTGYTADRWAAVWGTAGRTFSRQSGFANSEYCLRFQRNSGSTGVGYSGIVNIFETTNSISLQGKTVTLSFDARCGANFSPTNNLITAYVITGTGTDQTGSTWYSPGWTGASQILNAPCILTTSSQRFTATGVIPANATQISIYFFVAPTGTAGANDYFEITNVQLEAGAVATPFEFEDYGTTLTKCQRYFWRHAPATTGYLSFIYAGSQYRMTIASPVTMRATPHTITATGWYGGTTPSSSALNNDCVNFYSPSGNFYTDGGTVITLSAEL